MRSGKAKLAVWLVLLLSANLATAAGPAARAPAEKKPRPYLRLSRDRNDVPLALETAIVRFASAKGYPRTLHGRSDRPPSTLPTRPTTTNSTASSKGMTPCSTNW